MITLIIFKILTPFLSCLIYLKLVISTLPTNNTRTTNTHQFTRGNGNVERATTNNNKTDIIIRKMIVKMVFILNILM